MSDLLYLGTAAVLFLLTWGFCLACGRLGAQAQERKR